MCFTVCASAKFSWTSSIRYVVDFATTENSKITEKILNLVLFLLIKRSWNADDNKSLGAQVMTALSVLAAVHGWICKLSHSNANVYIWIMMTRRPDSTKCNGK